MNDKGQTLLHAAAKGGANKVAGYLLKHHQANLYEKDVEGNTPKDLFAHRMFS